MQTLLQVLSYHTVERELPGEDAIMIRKDGQRVVIEPGPPASLLAVLVAVPTLDEAN